MNSVNKEAYRLVGNEIKHQDFEPVCLSIALEESSGDYNLAMSIYVKKRVQALNAQLVISNLRKQSFNERQQESADPFVGFTSEGAPPDSTSWVSVCIGHLCLIVASCGIIWAASIHLGVDTWRPLSGLGIFIVSCTNILPILFFLSIRFRFPDCLYQRVLLSWVSLMCLVSFGLGLLILKTS